MPIDPKIRFWKQVKKTKRCWVWIGGSRNPLGYGIFDGESASRVSWEFKHGPIKNGLHVLHKCDNPPCVNPKHLWLGTHLENMRDKVKKGRQPRGEWHHKSKLTWEKVKIIRKLYKTGKYGQRKLAKMFKMTRNPIRQVIKNITWTKK